MWRQSFTALRERTSHHVGRGGPERFVSTGGKSAGAVTLQLDYYMSLQFAGVANALVNGLYASKGVDVNFLPTCPVGKEQERVRHHQDGNKSAITMGTVEQNIFAPTLAANPSLSVSGVAAMFRTSPLAIASLANTENKTIGAHEDTVELMQRIFPQHTVVASPRGTKNADLLAGTYGGIQVYTTTEVPTLLQTTPDVEVTPLEGLNGTKLGYGQLLFAANECLLDDRRQVVQAFLEATFEGWEQAIRDDPATVVNTVKEAQKMLKLDDEQNDHWHPETELENLKLLNYHLKETYQGDRYGVISPSRWSTANQWLLQDPKIEDNFGLDATVWQPDEAILAGNELARCALEDAAADAASFFETHGRKPSLTVITVGELKRGKEAERRLQLYSTPSQSWFSKTSAGEANGFDVQEIKLPADTTTDALLSEINKATKDRDGIQVMWPLPDHIDTTKVYNAIDVAKDADGIHFVGQCEIGNLDALAPVTPAAALALVEEYGVKVAGKRVLVIGRSPHVGAPIAQMMRQAGGATTVVHSDISADLMKEMVGESDIVVPCAGSLGMIPAEWFKEGAEVINVGKTFSVSDDKLVSDVAGDIGASPVARYSPVPGGIGPLSLPLLLQNTVRAAWNQM